MYRFTDNNEASVSLLAPCFFSLTLECTWLARENMSTVRRSCYFHIHHLLTVVDQIRKSQSTSARPHSAVGSASDSRARGPAFDTHFRFSFH